MRNGQRPPPEYSSGAAFGGTRALFWRAPGFSFRAFRGIIFLTDFLCRKGETALSTASERVTHIFAPVYDEKSAVLVLGTMASPASRARGFYYSHPQNRFWPVMAALFGEERPRTPEEKAAFVLRHRVALADTLFACEIEGAGDASIRNPEPSDLSLIFKAARIRAVFTTGSAAHRFYRKFHAGKYAAPEFCLPSTSPANAKMSLSDLVEIYRKITDYL